MVPGVLLTGFSTETSASTFSWFSDTVQSSFTWWVTFHNPKDGELIQENEMQKFMIFIYKWVSMVVYTPAFLFQNDFFKEMIRIFSGLSIGVVTIGCMVEGFKKLLGWSGTSFKQIAVRLPFMIGVCGFAPLGFVKAVEAMNWITNMIFNLGTNLLNRSVPYRDELWQLDLYGDIFEAAGFLLFLILYIALLVPLMLHHGRRWFSMLSLGVLTPFAMLGYVFDSLKGLHDSWWTTLKGLFLVQIVYSVFVTILALMMFAVPFPNTLEGIFGKLLVVLGGLYTLAVPPTFVKKFFDKGPTPQQSYAILAKKLGKFMLFKKA